MSTENKLDNPLITKPEVKAYLHQSLEYPDSRAVSLHPDRSATNKHYTTEPLVTLAAYNELLEIATEATNEYLKRALREIPDSKVVHSVFLTADDDKYLPMEERLLLERLSVEYDGVFPSKRSWEAFVRGNFLGTGAYKDYFVDEIKPSTIKRWCYPEEDYIHRFVARTGGDGWKLVDAADIYLEFDYEVFYQREYAFPASVEIYVTARFKAQE